MNPPDKIRRKEIVKCLMSNRRARGNVGISLALARLQKRTISIIDQMCERKKVAYSGDLWGSAPEYLGDNVLLYASAKLVFEIGI